jgi:hypothetical protein
MKPRYRPSVSEDIGVDSIAARIERNLEADRIEDERLRSFCRDTGSFPV